MPPTFIPEYSVIVTDELGIRRMQFGENVIQGAMHIVDRDRLLLDYTHKMMAWMLFCGVPQSILHIGLGAASITRFLLRHFPSIQLDVVEIDHRVVDVAYKHFFLPRNDKRLRVHVGDGSHFLKSASKLDRRWDLILVDAFGNTMHAPRFQKRDFVRICSLALNETGLLVINLGACRGIDRRRAVFEEVFGENVRFLTPTKEGNVIVISSKNTDLHFGSSILDGIRDECCRQFGLRTGDWQFQ